MRLIHGLIDISKSFIKGALGCALFIFVLAIAEIIGH